MTATPNPLCKGSRWKLGELSWILLFLVGAWVWPGGALPGAAGGLGLGLSNLGNVSASGDVADGFSVYNDSLAPARLAPAGQPSAVSPEAPSASGGPIRARPPFAGRTAQYD